MCNDTASHVIKIDFKLSLEELADHFVKACGDDARKFPHRPFSHKRGVRIRNFKRKRIFKVKRFNNRLEPLDKL